MSALGQYRKAIAAGIVTLGGGIVQAALSEPGITGNEWYGIVGATIVTFGTVWAVANSPDATATNASPVTVAQKGDQGQVTGTVIVPGPTATLAPEVDELDRPQLP